MGRKVDGGIEKHQDLERFRASASDISPKDQIDLMSRCWFSLTPGRTEPIEHEFVNLKTRRTETIRITGSAEHGVATIHDQDLIIFAISQWVEAKRQGQAPSRRICFTPYQFFRWINKAPHGTAYARLREALHRLKTTNIETTIRSASSRRGRIKQFSWISEWELVEEAGQVKGVEIVLAEWLFESIQTFHVLTLDKRYFEIPGSVERWLYLYARKATGGAAGQWSESFRSLYRKSASQQAFKHYASALRKLIRKNDLPGLWLEKRSSARGLDLLFMERIEKRSTANVRREDAPPQEKPEQLLLLEHTPLEEAWENVLVILRRQLSAPTVAAWFEKLQLVNLEAGVLNYRAPNRFVAERVKAQYEQRLVSAWQALGYEAAFLRIDIRRVGN